MNDGLTDLYQEVILDHSRNPRNFGPAEEADRTARGNNPLCGDRVTVFLNLDGDEISDAQFDARGCAISLASASMMTEMIKGKSVAEAKALFEKFYALVTGENGVGASPDLAKLETLSGVKNFPTRIKCATLAWHAMVAALDGVDEDVKTE
jgi:nitrogen fixation NifU-like protein